jgi:hypothetical protein
VVEDHCDLDSIHCGCTLFRIGMHAGPWLEVCIVLSLSENARPWLFHSSLCSQFASCVMPGVRDDLALTLLQLSS